MSHQDKLDAIRSNRRDVFGHLATLDEPYLNRMTRWGRGPAYVGYLFLRFSDHDEEHARQIGDTLGSLLSWQPSKMQRTLGMAERTRGDLLAALVGLGDDDLDVAPVEPQGEWPLRQILSHLVATEHSYRINTIHSINQHRKGEPLGDHPDAPEDTDYLNLSFDELLTALDVARNQSIAELAGMNDEVLSAPAIWYGASVDVNWRLMRFSHHEREHAAHIQKWRVQTGRHQTDAQRLLGLGWQSHGMVRAALVGVPEELVGADPGEDEWSVDQILDHLLQADQFFTRMIHEAE